MQTKKILIADDDPEDISIIKDAMELLNVVDVIWPAQNGQHALEVLQKSFESSTMPCLIVLDLNMPKMNGMQTLSNLKADDRFKDIPVIIYSTSINPLEKETCLRLGAHSYIPKPVSFKESMETAKVFLQFCGLKSFA